MDITSTGGGGGGASNGGSAPAPMSTGGSGGGRGGREPGAVYAGNNPPQSPPQGNPGGDCHTPITDYGLAAVVVPVLLEQMVVRLEEVLVVLVFRLPLLDTNCLTNRNSRPSGNGWFAGGGNGGSYPSNPLRHLVALVVVVTLGTIHHIMVLVELPAQVVEVVVHQVMDPLVETVVLVS